MLHLPTLFDARIDLRLRSRALALFLRSHRNGRLRTWQKDVDPKVAGADRTRVGATAAATEPAKAGPVLGDKAVMASPPARVDREKPAVPAMIDGAHDRSALIAKIAKTVIAEVLPARSAATVGSGHAMRPNARPSSRSMTDLRFPTTSRPRIWTSMRCVAFMAWPTNLLTGSRGTS